MGPEKRDGCFPQTNTRTNGEGGKGKTRERRPGNVNTHLEDFHHHLLVVGDVDGFKDFAVLAAAEFPHQLIIILVPGGERKKKEMKRWCPDRIRAALQPTLLPRGPLLYTEV